jgi:hypothetical protein
MLAEGLCDNEGVQGFGGIIQFDGQVRIGHVTSTDLFQDDSVRRIRRPRAGA